MINAIHGIANQQQPPPAAIAPIASVSVGTSGPADAASSPIDTTGATLIVIAQSQLGSATEAPIDSEGNTWTALTNRAGGNLSVRLFYCLNPTTNAAHTFTAVWGGGSYASISVTAFSSVGSYESESGAGAAGGTTQQPGSLLPAGANSLLVTGLMTVSATPPNPSSINSGFTIATSMVNTFTTVNIAIAYKVQMASGAENPTWSSNVASERTAAAMAVFTHA